MTRVIPKRMRASAYQRTVDALSVLCIDNPGLRVVLLEHVIPKTTHACTAAPACRDDGTAAPARWRVELGEHIGFACGHHVLVLARQMLEARTLAAIARAQLELPLDPPLELAPPRLRVRRDELRMGMVVWHSDANAAGGERYVRGRIIATTPRVAVRFDHGGFLFLSAAEVARLERELERGELDALEELEPELEPDDGASAHTVHGGREHARTRMTNGSSVAPPVRFNREVQT